MRKPFDLDLQTIDKFTVLIHSVYGVGKTHLLGDMLRTESTKGTVRYINVKGQDGQLAISGMGLGKGGALAETIEDYKDWESLVAEYAGLKLRAVGLDGLKELSMLGMRSKVGDRLPRTGDNKSNEWGEVHFLASNMYKTIRLLADIVVVTVASDKYTDPVVGGEPRINPDLPGAQSRTVVGEFDFVAYLEATSLASSTGHTLSRKLLLAPNKNISTRQRLPRPITTPIDIPEGGGGWQNFMNAVQTAMNKGGTK